MTDQARRRYAAPMPVTSPGIGPLRFSASVLVFVVPVIALLIAMRAGAGAAVLFLFAASAVGRSAGRPPPRKAAVRGDRPAAATGGGRAGRGHRLPVRAVRSHPGRRAAAARPARQDGVLVGAVRRAGPAVRVDRVAGRAAVGGGAAGGAGRRRTGRCRDSGSAGGRVGAATGNAGQIARGAALLSATVETLPDDGALLQAHVASLLQPGAPDFAREVLTAAARELPTGVSATVGHVAITFTERSLGIEHSAPREARAETAAAEFGRMLPDLSAQLAAAGTSTAVPLDAWALSRRIKEAFDPAAVLEHAELAAAGQPVRVRWEDCGPRAADDLMRRYLHDSGASVVFEATRMARGSITDTLLETLAGPMRHAPRKRPILLCRPIPVDQAAAKVDRGVKTAINRVNRRKGPVHAHDAASLTAAERAAAEEAAGAGVTDLSLLLTVTANTAAGEDVEEAAAAVSRAGRAHFGLTRVDGGHAAAFAIGLGIGLDPWSLAVVPTSLREHL